MYNNIEHLKNQSGQILVLILLAVLIAMTVALAVVSRNITQIKEGARIEQSTRALAAAEAGIEEGLKQISEIQPGDPIPTPNDTAVTNALNLNLPASDSNANVDYSFTQVGGGSSPITFELVQDETIQLTLEGYSAADSIAVSWCKDSDSTQCNLGNLATSPAIEISYIYQDTATGEYKFKKEAYDKLAASRVNGFNSASVTSGGAGVCGNYFYCISFTSPGAANNSPKALRLRLMYNSDKAHEVEIDPAGNLPVQGIEISATGTSGSAQRTVKAYKSYAFLPSVFDFALFSGGAITKN